MQDTKKKKKWNNQNDDHYEMKYYNTWQAEM